jgi:hypothetical protein
MAIQNINVGNAANDGTGDDLREAFIKVNQNFQTLDSIAEQTGNNLGTAGAEVFANKIGNVLNFRRLVGQGNVVLTQHDTTISISADINTNFVITGDSGSLIAGAGINYNILGAGTNTIGVDENTKTITVTGRIENDLNPVLGESLNANNKNITAVNNFSAFSVLTNDFSLTNINGVDYDSRLGRYIEGFDFGDISTPAESILDWVILQIGVDLGTFNQPSTGQIDLGILG